jgi:hypothetical protein
VHTHVYTQRTKFGYLCERPQQVIDPEPSGHDPPLGDLVLAFEAPAVDAEQNLDAVADLLGSLSWGYSPIELGEQAGVVEIVRPSGERYSIVRYSGPAEPNPGHCRHYLLPTASPGPMALPQIPAQDPHRRRRTPSARAPLTKPAAMTAHAACPRRGHTVAGEASGRPCKESLAA